MNKFDSIKIGDRASVVHKITSADVEKFVDLTGDDNRIHIDSEYAKRTVFKKPVVHGMLGASFISTVIGTQLPGDGALWFSQSLEFILPVRIGDEITISVEVKNKYEREKVIELQTDIFNQNQQKVTTGSAKVKIIEQQEATEEIKLEKSKIALVVGASGGIGKAVALRLAEDGFDLALHYFSNKLLAQELEKSIKGLGRACHIYCADITDETQVKSMVSEVQRRFGSITAVVNCATVKVVNTKFASLEWSELESHFQINIKSNFFLAKSILPIMQSQKFGRIVNMTTHYIDGTPPVELLAYVTGKSALFGFTKSLAVEYAPFGITANLISPGMTDTELIADIPEKTRLMTVAKTPVRRLAKPADIAGAVSYLLSSNAEFITGETIRINGGQVMQ